MASPMASTLGKEVLVESDSSVRKRKKPLALVGHFHEEVLEVSPTHFYKVILAPGLDLLPIPSAFREHIGDIPKEIILKTNTGCSWQVSIVDYNGQAAIDNGWAPFAMCHEVKIRYFLTFKILKRNVYSDGSEIVKKCDAHPMNFKLKAAVQN